MYVCQIFIVIQLIENLLIYDKEKRYSVDEALNHIWFSLNVNIFFFLFININIIIHLKYV